MRGRVVRKTSIVVGLVALVSLGLAAGVARASGGGGCGRAVTDAEGTRIAIRNFCFGPTILRVAPGETVTWVNKDGFPHTVLGANAAWGGFDALRRNGGDVSYRFVRSGVYPYVCTYHPGMVGAIVVGNGRGTGSANTVTTAAGPVILGTPPSPETEPVGATGPDAATSDVSSARWPAAAWWWGIGVVLAAVAAFTFARRRHVAAR